MWDMISDIIRLLIDNWPWKNIPDRKTKLSLAMSLIGDVKFKTSSGPVWLSVSFLAAKAQLNTCTCLVSVCLSVCPSVVKTEFLPVYTIVQLVTVCDSLWQLCNVPSVCIPFVSLCAPLCPFVPFVPLYAPFTPSYVMFCLCAFPLCPFVPPFTCNVPSVCIPFVSLCAPLHM